ncbi:hypothetical protein [Saccharothrix luteola]|uniref:hypothetical protein n=1 Tax=Saccharothrix luteola TaxID=2893018 RepID=UPI001E282BC7|nr:hypothetical protein [Saccharothrix luteola]MCC8251673.1 hypothetical protein [Saccharothrix luteola]
MENKVRGKSWAALGLLVAALFSSPFTAQAATGTASDGFQALAWRTVGNPYPNTEQGRRQCEVAGALLIQEGAVRAVQCLVDGETGDRIWLWADFK